MFLIGHSHVTGLEAAATALGVPYRSLNLWGFDRPVLYDGGAARLTPALEDMIQDRLVISAVGGSAHDILGLAQHPRRFDVVLPEEPDLPLDAGAEIIPVEAVARATRMTMEDEQLDLVRLLARPDRRVIHVESPPPSPPGERFASEIGYLAFTAGGPLGPSSPWLRYKLWRVHSKIVREALEAAGVEFLAHPKAAMDGCTLRPEFYAYPCHANTGYGELVLRQLGYAA